MNTNVGAVRVAVRWKRKVSVHIWGLCKRHAVGARTWACELHNMEIYLYQSTFGQLTSHTPQLYSFHFGKMMQYLSQKAIVIV